MDVMADHARRWRYKFNHSQCAVVVAGKRGATRKIWLLSGERVQEKKEYKYLGVPIQRDGRRGAWVKARTMAARGSMASLWWGGARSCATADRRAARARDDATLAPLRLRGRQLDG